MERRDNTVAITAIGMVSSLGLDVVASCAAARAGLALPKETEHSVLDDKSQESAKIVGYTVGSYTKGFTELGRWVRLGSLALKNLLVRASMAPQELTKARIFVNLPSGYYHEVAARQRAKQRGTRLEPDEGPSYDQLKPWYAQGIVPKMLATLDVSVDPFPHEVFFDDEVGIVSAAAAALEALSSRRAGQCIVGGIDSLVDPFWLTVCNELGLLKTAIQPVGVIPGEGAAFLRLELASSARTRGAPILATLGQSLVTREETPRFSDKPPTGTVLSEVILESLKQAPRPCTTFYCDVNGDAVRAFEWGNAQVRLASRVDGWHGVIPAMAFGATRAASGFMAACMAVCAFQSQRHGSEGALIWASADSGTKGSLTLFGRDADDGGRE